jgi:hypothetical protein
MGSPAVPEAGSLHAPIRTATGDGRGGAFPLDPQRASPTARRPSRGHCPEGVARHAARCRRGACPQPSRENAGTARNEQRLARPGRTGLSTSSALPLMVASATCAAPRWPTEAARPHGQPGCGGHRSPPWRRGHAALTAPGGRCRSGDRSPRTPSEELCSSTAPLLPRYPTSHGAHPIPG